MKIKIFFNILTISMLSACSGGSGSGSSNSSRNETPTSSNTETVNAQNQCRESGEYDCKTGKTEPLYPFQWALNYKDSFFKRFPDIWKNSSDPENYDLNIEAVHKQGIKGQGINVMILDDGLDIQHEDLLPNINRHMLYNFENHTTDPTPTNLPQYISHAHGTNVAGIIAAAQNGKGVMGISPKVNLGGARFNPTILADAPSAYGGADFSKDADIFNGSFGENPEAPIPYGVNTHSLAPMRALVNLRRNKGAIYLKATGNEFVNFHKRDCPEQFKGMISCENPAHDIEALEPTVINIAAANAKGIKASYSSAGAVNWVTGLAGEFGEGGTFGEGNPSIPLQIKGPVIFSTDLQGCQRGYSRNVETDNIPDSLFIRGLSLFNDVQNNTQCNYSYLNGTSASTPTVSAVTALILQANPNLTWRDVREILRQSSRVIDKNYPSRVNANRIVDLTTGAVLPRIGTRNDIQDGATQVSLDFGWQTNGAGIQYSNWYGFGLVDANAAVNLAKRYRAGSLKSPLNLPDFESAFPARENLSYEKVTKLGVISVNRQVLIDQFQLRVSGPLCVGSVGFFVKSPSGVISDLSLPYNIYYKGNVSNVENYGLGSYAFYGENAAGNWEVFAVSGDKGRCESTISASTPLKVEYRIIPKAYS